MKNRQTTVKKTGFFYMFSLHLKITYTTTTHQTTNTKLNRNIVPPVRVVKVYSDQKKSTG